MTDVKRLFQYFQPSRYALDLHLDRFNLQTAGSVEITGTKNAADEVIYLHAKDLQIKSVRINNSPAIYKVENDELQITTPVNTTNLTILVVFSSTITKPMHGIYPTYTAKGEVLLATQFESHHAREAFPCIDEPEAKAIFDITLHTDVKTVLCNMPMKDQTLSRGVYTTVFDSTPIMSSYLVAFVVGDLQKASTTTENGTEIAVWASNDHDIESLIFPLEVAVRTTEFLNNYFGIPYPLPKCDHVALPDFSSGAMENWGLITYREIALLADPDTISTSSKEMIATVIAHEISHQWFGNLVTMKWWDDLWLNESFANLMEYVVINALYPDWEVMMSFAAHEALSAFRRDILPGVQSVATPVHHPDAISTLFDPSIVYAKGSRLLNMVYHLVGDKAFRKGLRAYFKKHAYGNTTGEDLWVALSKASGIDVATIMHPWITQSGFPYLTVTPEKNGVFTISQQQLTSDGSVTDKLWPVPLWPEPSIEGVQILTTASAQVNANSESLRINTVGGHYVTHYTSAEQKEALLKKVKNGSIEADERLLVLNDELLLARCGVASITEALYALQFFSDEVDESVWSVISMLISDSRMIIEDDEVAEQKIKQLAYTLAEPHLKRLGMKPLPAQDSTNDKKLRSIVVGLGVFSENEEVIKEALAIYESSDGFDTLPADIRSAMLSAAVKHGPNEVFTKLFSAYPTITNGDIQMDICAALCTTKSTEQSATIIAELKNSSFVRLQDLDRFLAYLLRNRYTRSITWDWLTNNWDWITETFAQDKSYDNYPRYAAAAFSTIEWLDAYKQHFNQHKDNPTLARNIDLGIKEINGKIAWRKRDQKKLTAWLTRQQ